MGHRHTPARLGGADSLCLARGGATPPVAEHREVAAARAGSRNPEAGSRGAAAWLLLAGLRFYQACLSPLMPYACKFYPSCSRYACQAIELRGARRGAWLALRRLLRCRPFSPGGYDPVPEIEPGPDAGSVQP